MSDHFEPVAEPMPASTILGMYTSLTGAAYSGASARIIGATIAHWETLPLTLRTRIIDALRDNGAELNA